MQIMAKSILTSSTKVYVWMCVCIYWKVLKSVLCGVKLNLTSVSNASLSIYFNYVCHLFNYYVTMFTH